MNVDEMKSLLGMKREWDANQDRKAFLQAMAAFKLNPPAILKDRRVQDGIADYRYATLGNVCNQIIRAAATDGFTHRWVPSHGERGEQVITCEVSHATVERLQRGKGVLYWQCPRGESTDTPVSKLLAKTRYKSSTTARNLRTVEKLLTD